MDTNRNARRSIGVGLLALATAMLTAGAADAALTIGGGATQNVICAAHVCRATRPSAVLNASSLANMLASSDVTVVSGSKAQDIVIHSPFSWTSSHRLTLDSYRSIAVDYTVAISGPGAVTLTTNDGGSGGTFVTQYPGRIDFWDLSSNLVINGTSYTLVGDIATLASGITANASGHYALAKNYDAGVDGTYTAPPIHTDYGFTGTFEGLGHIIDHLTVHAIKARASEGLFAWVSMGGAIENIGLTAVSIRSGSRALAGALVAWNSGTVINAFAKGQVHGADNYAQVGGLVGQNAGSIISSYTAGKVIGGPIAQVGGLVGISLPGSTIWNSHSTARIVGMRDTSTGGLVGLLDGSLTDSWASGDVSNGEDDHEGYSPGAGAGGLVGTFNDEASNNSNFENCYATGNVAGGSDVNAGGLIGMLSTNFETTAVPITNSYATGRTTVSPGHDPPEYFAGGVVGGYPGSFSDVYWDTDTSGIPSDGVGDDPNEPGVTGLSDAQLKSGLPAGFDPSVWAENPNINGGRPYLIADPPSP